MLKQPTIISPRQTLLMDGLACFVLSIIPFLIPIPIIWARIKSKRALNILTLPKIALFSLLTGGFWSIGIVSLADKLIPSASESDRIVLYETRLIGWIGVFLFCFLGLLLFYKALT